MGLLGLLAGNSAALKPAQRRRAAFIVIMGQQTRLGMTLHTQTQQPCVRALRTRQA